MDSEWFLLLNRIPTQAPAFSRAIVAVAMYGIILYAGLAVWFWWRPVHDPPGRLLRRRIDREGVLLAILAAGLSLGVSALLNAAVPRPRPFLVLPAHLLIASPPHDASFPSDHAAVSSAIAMTLAFSGEVAWGSVSLLFAALIGVTRVMIGVHYPSDILGGLIVGLACASISIGAREVIRPALNFIVSAAVRLRLG